MEHGLDVQCVHWSLGSFAANGFSCFIAEFLSKHCGKLKKKKNLNKNKFRNKIFKSTNTRVFVLYMYASSHWRRCAMAEHTCQCAVPSLISLIHCFWCAVFYMLFFMTPQSLAPVRSAGAMNMNESALSFLIVRDHFEIVLVDPPPAPQFQLTKSIFPARCCFGLLYSYSLLHTVLAFLCFFFRHIIPTTRRFLQSGSEAFYHIRTTAFKQQTEEGKLLSSVQIQPQYRIVADFLELTISKSQNIRHANHPSIQHNKVKLSVYRNRILDSIYIFPSYTTEKSRSSPLFSNAEHTPTHNKRTTKQTTHPHFNFFKEASCDNHAHG